MGSSVSQIQYWRNDGASDNIKEAGPGAVYLSYNIFLGLSVLGGFLGLDHLYLRSPLTFIAKLITNIFTFGTWWLYDATQAIFNRDVVKIFGLGVPGLGPRGIAAGVLAKDIPDKKHMAFFVYALALFGGGIFGLDSFITGDKQTGFIRLMCLIMFFFAPVAVPSIVSLNAKNGAKRVSINGSILLAVMPVYGAPKYSEFCLITVSVLNKNITTLYNHQNIATGAVCTATSAVDTAASTVKTAVKVGSAVVSETAAAAQTIGKLGAAAESLKLNPQDVQDAMKALEQKGGGIINNDSGILPYMVIGTFGLIAVSGFILTYRRLRQNGKQHKNDIPPTPSESGVLRKSDKKEFPNTA